MNSSNNVIGTFGGHQTFVLRSSWVSKACKMLAESTDKGIDFASIKISDSLGIGQNMSISLAFWLRCTKIATKVGNNNVLTLSKLGLLIYEHDPYFQDLGSIWSLHSNLMCHLPKPEVWSWLFNSPKMGKFKAFQLEEDFHRHIAMNLSKRPAEKTINNDIRCILNSYAVVLAEDSLFNPEAESLSLFQKLNLILKFPKTSTYEFTKSPDPIPIELLGYHLSSLYFDHDITEIHLEIPEKKVLYEKNSLGLTFRINGVDLLDIIDNQKLSKNFTFERIRLSEQWGILLSNKAPLEWLKEYYIRQKVVLSDNSDLCPLGYTLE